MTVKEFKVQYALGSLSDVDKVNLAAGKYTAKKILTILSTDKDWYVRCKVAMNSNAPTEVLKKLSTDENESVRCCMEFNEKW